MAFSFDNKRVMSGGFDNTNIKIWDIEPSFEEYATLKGHTKDIKSVAFSPDSKKVVSGGIDECIKLWNVESKQCIVTI